MSVVIVLTKSAIFAYMNLPQCARSMNDVAPLKHEFALSVRMQQQQQQQKQQQQQQQQSLFVPSVGLVCTKTKRERP